MNGNDEGNKWILETAEDKAVHDMYGDMHVVSSSWIKKKGDMQTTIYRLYLDGKDITNKRKEISDKVLRNQIGETVGYGKMRIIKSEPME